MKVRNLFFAVLASAAVLVGCEKEEDLGGASLELSTRTLVFEKEASSQEITITATRDWKAEFSDKWVSGPASGEASSKSQTLTISVLANDGAKRTAEITFTIGTITKTVTVTQNGQAVVDGSTILDAPLAKEFGVFVPDNESIWTLDTQYGYVKATAFKVDNAPDESWLVAPVDLTGEGAATLTFEHACNFFGSVENMRNDVTVWAKKDGGEWTKLDVPVYPIEDSWTFVKSYDVDLSAFLGGKIQLGFKYAPTTEEIGTWEIKNVKIVRSNAKKAIVPSTTGLSVGYNDTKAAFDIQSNTSWTVSSSSAAFTVSPASGEGNATITVSFSANDSETEPKTSTITVSGTDADPVDITITQDVKPAAGSEIVTVNTNSADLVLTDETHDTYGAGYYLTQDNVTVGNYKYKSTTKVNSTYTTPIRVYQSAALYVEVPAGNIISSVKINCNEDKYAKEIKVLTDGDKAIAPQGTTLVWTGKTADNVFVAQTTAQTRVESIEVTYSKK